MMLSPIKPRFIIFLFGTAGLAWPSRAAMADDCAHSVPANQGPIPSDATVEVTPEYVEVRFKWDGATFKGFDAGTALEVEVILENYADFAAPATGEDRRPQVGFSSDLPGAYRDIYNFSPADPISVGLMLTIDCGISPRDSLYPYYVAGLVEAINLHPDTAQSFQVGSLQPEAIEPDRWYFVRYFIHRTTASVVYARVQSSVVSDSNSHIFWGADECALLAGDPLGFLADWADRDTDEDHYAKWLNRLCVPTGSLLFKPNTDWLCDTPTAGCDNGMSDEAECCDRDLDGWYGPTGTAKMFGTWADCNDHAFSADNTCECCSGSDRAAGYCPEEMATCQCDTNAGCTASVCESTRCFDGGCVYTPTICAGGSRCDPVWGCEELACLDGDLDGYPSRSCGGTDCVDSRPDIKSTAVPILWDTTFLGYYGNIVDALGAYIDGDPRVARVLVGYGVWGELVFDRRAD